MIYDYEQIDQHLERGSNLSSESQLGIWLVISKDF